MCTQTCTNFTISSANKMAQTCLLNVHSDDTLSKAQNSSHSEFCTFASIRMHSEPFLSTKYKEEKIQIQIIKAYCLSTVPPGCWVSYRLIWSQSQEAVSAALNFCVCDIRKSVFAFAFVCVIPPFCSCCRCMFLQTFRMH